VVDALAGRETRRHKDLDLLVAADDASRVGAVLAEQGFGHGAGTSPVGVYRDVADCRVDISVVTPDPGSRGYLQETEHGLIRVAGEDLGGRGTIGCLDVRCLTASAQPRAHTGYEAPTRTSTTCA
jgi:lincosamide nucleotidyltransferase A/C/D/E